MNFKTLSIEEAESMTNKVVDEILNVNPESVTKGFYYWQGIITSLAMIISASKTIESCNQKKEYIERFDSNKGFSIFLNEIIKEQESIIKEADYNYLTYEKLLFDLGIKIV